MIYRYSSIRDVFFTPLLEKKLYRAKSYDRIAGYFSSSILDVVGESIESMEGRVRIVCNSELEMEDVQTSQLAANAIRREWCDFKPEELPGEEKRFEKLYNLLITGKLEVRVLPRDKFGLAHGKAGIITTCDGYKTTFLGSANETYSAWKRNYELVWEDDSEDAIKWLTDEFEALWNNPYAIDLSKIEYVVRDIERISKRVVIKTLDDWKNDADPASVTVESAIYRKNFGLWEHQKYFINRVFEDHKMNFGARYVLADQVGLGKTVQLALSAQLMGLYGDKPILIVVPKTLVEQWQGELTDLLDIPSAAWINGHWVDEAGTDYPLDIASCPRKIGIISQGIITNGSDSCIEMQSKLLSLNYEGVIVDESHRARRSNLGEAKELQSPEMNNLYRFLVQISKRTKSMLLATATPVQMYPIEAYDLLNILSQKNDSVLGGTTSNWRNRNLIPDSLTYIIGTKQPLIDNLPANWDWVRNPMPPALEHAQTFGQLRSRLDMSDEDFVSKVGITEFTKPDSRKLETILESQFYRNNNPYIRHIIRRERSFLETHKDPETGLPFLQPINVVLFGEDKDEALVLYNYLHDAYIKASEFCELLKLRTKAAGFFKTLLLKRIGSSMVAGYLTGYKMLTNWDISDANEDEEEQDDENGTTSVTSDLKKLTLEETQVLRDFVAILKIAIDENNLVDPKFNKVYEILTQGAILSTGIKTRPWKEMGCVLFSQYLDTAEWVSKSLSISFADETIGLYAGGDKSGYYVNGIKIKETKENLKKMVKSRKIKVFVGTDAASEGLNLQTLGSLINLDLPWNPTRLEQRKGRIQRIGQANDAVYIYNLRYKDSVEDRVHELLSGRMRGIYMLFGQIPDVLEDVWVDVALNNQEEAKKRINAIPKQHPFALKYHANVEAIDWDRCDKVLNNIEARKAMMKGW